MSDTWAYCFQSSATNPSRSVVHLLRNKEPYFLCGRPVLVSALQVRKERGRNNLCKHCATNYHGQGQGYEELP